MKAFLAGIGVTLLVLVAGAYFAVVHGWVPANADAKPGFLETWAAHHSLRATLRREAPTTPSPLTLTDANLIAGIKLYKINCAFCHGTSNGQASNAAMGLYQHAPQFARRKGGKDQPGHTYWVIQHGIRLTGMPSFGSALTDTQIWQVVLFLSHMNSLSPKAERIWKALPSSSHL